jgi:phosphohistidine phosphatase
VATSLDLPRVEVEARLYHAGASDLLERLCSIPPEVAEAMLVGHNPGLHELVGLLAPPLPEAFPTGTLAGLDLAIENWQGIAPGCGQLATFVVPRELTG